MSYYFTVYIICAIIPIICFVAMYKTQCNKYNCEATLGELLEEYWVGFVFAFIPGAQILLTMFFIVVIIYFMIQFIWINIKDIKI